MRLTALRAVCLAWLLLSGAAVSAGELTILPLHHRLAQDVLPLLRPLLAPDGTLLGDGARLLVRTTPENLAELEQALAALDIEAPRLRISVRQGVQDSGSGDGASVRYQVEDHSGLEPSLALEAEVASTRQHADQGLLQTVLTLDGQPAYIDTGSARPEPGVNLRAGPYGTEAQYTTHYQQTSSGFYVTPHVQGDEVELDLAAQLERPATDTFGGVEHQGASVHTRGQLGEWIAVGGAFSGRSQSGSGMTGGAESRSTSGYQLWLRVERAP